MYYLLKGTSEFKKFLCSATHHTTKNQVLKLFKFKDIPILMTNLVFKIALVILPAMSAEHMG